MTEIETQDGGVFVVHTKALRGNTGFFRSRLVRRVPGEHRMPKVHIDLDSAEFGLYIDILYRTLFVRNFKLRDTDFGVKRPLARITDFWNVAILMSSNKMVAMAEEAFNHGIRRYSPEQWLHWFHNNTKSFIIEEIKHLQECYRNMTQMCLYELVEKDIIQACANMPPQVFAEFFPYINCDLCDLVVKRFALMQVRPDQARLDRMNSGTRKAGQALDRTSGEPLRSPFGNTVNLFENPFFNEYIVE